MRLSTSRLQCAAIALFLLSFPAAGEFIGLDFGPGDTPPNWNAITRNGQYSQLKNADGMPTAVSLTILHAGTPYSVTATASTLPRSAPGLSAIDGNLYEFGGTFEAVLGGLVPGAEYDFYLFGLRSGASLRQDVRVTGANALKFTQQAGDGVLAINDQQGSADRDLESYARTVMASASGTLDLRVTGRGPSGSPFVIAGLALGQSDASGTSTSPATGPTAQSAAAVAVEPAVSPATQPPTPRPTPNGPDVLGMSLGMTLEQAMSIAQAAIPRMPLKSFDTDVGSIWGTRIRGMRYTAGFTGRYNDQTTNEKIAVAGFAPPRDGYVGAIGRTSYLGDMLYSDLRGSLIEKYGPPLYEGEPGSMRNVGSYFLSWSRDPDGNPLTDPEAIKACSRSGNNDAEDLAPAVMYLSDTKVQFNGQYDRCGFTMVVYAMPQDLLSLVRSYSIVLYDLNEIRKANAETIAVTEQQAQEIRSEREKSAQGRKPRL
ncbi:MAG: hypothetical protein R3E82_20005 [Pseudomonadales bacterium]